MKRENWFEDKQNTCGIEELILVTKKSWELGSGLHIAGLEGGCKGFFISFLCREVSPLVVITADRDGAETLWEDIRFFTPPEERDRVVLFPFDGFPYGDIPSLDIYAQRMKVLRMLSEGRSPVIIAPIQGLQGTVISQEVLITSLLRIMVGEELDRDTVARDVISLGYCRVEVVEERGEMSLRGAIMDIYPLDQQLPLRVEFLGDHVISIRIFDPETQRSTTQVKEVTIPPLSMEGEGDLFEYLPTTIPILLDSPQEIEQVVEAFWEELCRYNKEAQYLPPETVMGILRQRPWVGIGGLDVGTPGDRSTPRIALRASSNWDLTRQIKTMGLRVLAQQIQEWIQGRWAIYIIVQTVGQAKRLEELLEEWGLKAAVRDLFPSHPMSDRGRLVIVVGDLTAGFCLSSEGLAVVTEEEIFGVKRKVGRGAKAHPAPFSSFEDLKVGGYVVHVDYGIGIYRDLVRLEGEGVENDYLLIEYEGADKLYVPVDRLNLVHRYIGTGESSPKLDTLGGMAWRKTKKRAQRAVEQVAKELLEIYAARRAFHGFAFAPRDAYFKEFEAAFEYEETPDQAVAINQVMEDMEETQPMDRLICGDVGYGKTEVAIRAAFKASLENKQTAVLVPTTVLAQQHYQTFTSRLQGNPVIVESMSRFQSPNQQREILQRLREGKIDIIIGTHRLLQRDVSFRDLGLLIIDEEHRFGVSHKEKLKEMKKLVDCLTLTATPIPRTLQMSLLGIRDLSLITTPPPNRQAIRTCIITFDKEAIREAIRKEISRSGQIFFVHNRVKDIEVLASMLRELIPEVHLAVAHGQMRGKALEEVMMVFVKGEIDLLVCSSIIESGLDISNANTIIINHAERFGLADLYQLRGRVGRSDKKAFAYLIVPPRQHLSREALRRLRAIQELTELGSGFRLAMRDLEIRGAGNLLGHAQSGHIAEVGLELYMNLLEKAIQGLKGGAVKERITPEIRLPIEAFIPAEYIVDEDQRLVIYKRLSLLEEEEAIEEIKAELQDRFGDLPLPLVNLLEVIRLKVWLSTVSVQRFELMDTMVTVSFIPDGTISTEKMVALIEKGDGRYRLTPQMKLVYRTQSHDWREVIKETRNILQGLV